MGLISPLSGLTWNIIVIRETIKIYGLPKQPQNALEK